MFKRDAEQATDGVILIHWLFMTLGSGIMNSVAFIGLGMFATHVTGYATLLGLHLAHSQLKNALTALLVPFFFLIGAVISGLCIEARVRRGKTPHYDYVMYLCSALLLLVVFFAQGKIFDLEQGHFQLKNSFLPLSLICMASGLLNAALSHSSHSTVRITHLTGITTDLGRGISEIITFRSNDSSSREKIFKINRLRALTILFFIFGSLVGAVFYHLYSFNTLLGPACYFAYAGRHGRQKTLSVEF